MKKKALVFSALGDDSGCALRARYLSDALKRLGWESRRVSAGRKNLPLALEAFLSAPRFFFIAIFSGADLAVGIKPYPNCWIALWVLRLKGARVVLDVDDLDSGWRGGMLGALSRLIQFPAFLLLNTFSTHHKGIRARLQGRGKVLDLGQGVDTGLFHPSARGSEKILLFTAHLNIACQLELLMSCVGPWLKRHPDWKLVVAGGGPRQGEYQRRHQGAQALFTGALAPEQVADWISRSRICLSVYGEGEGNQFRVPMKCGEYLAAGKPVVSSLIPGLKNIEKYIYGCEANAKGFGAQLERLAQKRGDGREKRGAAWVRKNLSWDRIAADFVEDMA